jgi:hypothetical protein
MTSIGRNFRCFNLIGNEVYPNEGDIIPAGWSVEQCDEEGRTVAEIPLLVVGKTVNKALDPDWDPNSRYGSVIRYLSTEGSFCGREAYSPSI